MPRKQKKEKKTINIAVDGKTITVTMFPPKGRDKSWYAYWKGLPTRRSTKCRDYDDAVTAVHDMLCNNGSRSLAANTVLSDEEFDEIQRRHFSKRQDPAAQKRAQKSLKACMEAINSFRSISGLRPIAIATADDCERFQTEALKLPKNWRSKYPNSKEVVDLLSPNTVIKWSVACRAAFERANRNATNRKCVRGVVTEEKLLNENPWDKFNWIEGLEPEIRQYDDGELISILEFFEGNWPEVTIATTFAKTLLWSAGRKSEIAGLKWDCLYVVGEETHFEIVGKWSVRKWFRIPKGLYDELTALKVNDPHVFAAYNKQLRRHHENGPRPWVAKRVGAEFKPGNLGDWFYDRVVEWSESLPDGSACIHVFRKTTLQYARSGEDVNRQVAADARVSEGVMMTNYVRENAEELRQKSNRTFERIRASLSAEIAHRYGHTKQTPEPLKEQLQQALAAENWDLAARLTAELAKRNGQAG